MAGEQLELYWIPLGAGERPGQGVVRVCGRIYELIASRLQRRASRDLFHTALIAHLVDGTVSVEMAPTPDGNGSVERGVVAEGPVGLRPLSRLRLFRYEVRCWRNGTIPDLAYAVASPVRLSTDPARIRQVLDSLVDVPTPVWGRDEFDAGEMWNSNSVISWALTRTGLVAAAGAPPNEGRAPGWHAGVTVANRQRPAGAQSASGMAPPG